MRNSYDPLMANDYRSLQLQLQRQEANERRKARVERDNIIQQIYTIAYVRSGKFIPRKREYRIQLEVLVFRAKKAAERCRVNTDKVHTPSRVDPVYPMGDMVSRTRAEEIKRLTFWAEILELRGDNEKAQRVRAYLNRKSTINVGGRNVLVTHKN